MIHSLKDVTDKYDIVIGIECHVQLATKTKLFSPADNDARDAAPNTKVNQIDFGFPGVLPVLNERAVELAIRAGIALQADIPRVSRFERKHYFYPDLPFGYQITQLAEPVIVGGSVPIVTEAGDKMIRIHHAHIEMDAGKLTHPAGRDYSLVDLNRAGTPLIEIVSEADMSSPLEAKAYATALYQLMTFAGVTHGDLYHGNMRFDVNLSLKEKGAKEFGTRTETKNLNSFRSVERAAEYEAIRQAELLDKGEKITQETRGWNEDKAKTFSQRSKEDAHDYRYFPDADLPPVIIEEAQIRQVRETMPLLPSQFEADFEELKLQESVLNRLLADSRYAQFVYDIHRDQGSEIAGRVAAWWTALPRSEENDNLDVRSVPQGYYAELYELANSGEISANSSEQLFKEMIRAGRAPKQLAEERGLLQSNDEGEIEAIVDAVLADPASEKALADIRSGNDKAIGYLVGQAMKQSKGKANPAMLQQNIRKKL